MTEANRENSITIYPPQKPLDYPLSTALVEGIFGISKSTLFRWEKDRAIPIPERSIEGRREYQEADVRAIAVLVQNKYRANLRSVLSGEDPNRDSSTRAIQELLDFVNTDLESSNKASVKLPSGYTLHFGPRI